MGASVRAASHVAVTACSRRSRSRGLPRAMAETKKESFRKYLESAGVIDALTKVLVALYEEPDRPPNATSSIVQLLGGPSPEEYNALLSERDELQEKLKRAEEELAAIKGEAQ